MRNLMAVAVLAGLAAGGPARAAEKLKAGDKAPALKADKWLTGKEVAGFESGRVYVVEFWATWCGPCIVMMPHLGELQREFKDKVTVIGYTAKDQNNSPEKVEEFVKRRGPKLGYTFAYADARDTYDAWMKAAGQGGIPCSFVVDGTGTIAYIGHPMFLDLVLPKVVDKTWSVESGKADLDKADKAFDEVFKAYQEARQKGTPEDGLRAVAAFEKEYPALGKVPYLLGPKLDLHVRAKKFDELKVVAKNVIARATKAEDGGALGTVAGALRGAADQKEVLALAVAAAEAQLKIDGDTDLRALLGAAQTYDAAGDPAKAKAYAKKAVEASPDENTRKQVERMLKPILDGKKDGQ